MIEIIWTACFIIHALPKTGVSVPPYVFIFKAVHSVVYWKTIGIIDSTENIISMEIEISHNSVMAWKSVFWLPEMLETWKLEILGTSQFSFLVMLIFNRFFDNRLNWLSKIQFFLPFSKIWFWWIDRSYWNRKINPWLFYL